MPKIKLPADYIKLEWHERRAIREQYIKKQKGLCIYCNGELNKEAPKKILNKKINWSLFPDNFLKYPIHLHHNHNTNMTEGAVHNYCNAVMWQYEGK